MEELAINNKGREVVFPSFAKINLTLDVGGLRPDGYHQITSVLQTVSLADTLSFTRIPVGIAVSCSAAGVPGGQENLAYRALAMISHRLPGGVRVEIEKRIPQAAGLGGGSSNAATALKGADTLYTVGMEEEEMLAAAAMVGSDVPFFILGGTVLATGRGERVTRVSPLPGFWVVLVKPPFEVSTGKIYRLYMEKKEEPRTPRLLHCLEKGDRKGITDALGNDLESVTIKLYPEIASIKERLFQLGALGAMMAGSGPTVFGLFSSKDDALQAAEKLRDGDAGLIVVVCRTISAGEMEGG